MEKQLTPEEVNALEIKKERINKEMNNYSQTIDVFTKKEKELKETIVSLQEDIDGLEAIKEDRKQEILNLENTISEKREERNAQESLKDDILKEIKKEEKVLEGIKKSQIAVNDELEKVIKKTGSLVNREAYVSGQEQYLKEQFKRIGLNYQSYA